MGIQQMQDDAKKIRKLKQKNIFLVILAFLIIAMVILALFGCLYMIFGAPIFKGPYDYPGSRWYSSNPSAELVVDENNESNESLKPITFTINGEQKTYYIDIHESMRHVKILKSDQKSCILEGSFAYGLNKFVIEVDKCNDDSFKEYDEIVFYKD